MILLAEVPTSRALACSDSATLSLEAGPTQLDNGNILVCAGGQRQSGLPAQIVEVAGADNPAEVWKLSVDDRVIYRSRRLSLYGGPID